jgi:hypothetical protein
VSRALSYTEHRVLESPPDPVTADFSLAWAVENNGTFLAAQGPPPAASPAAHGGPIPYRPKNRKKYRVSHVGVGIYKH